jgi:hypothetical protein
MLIELLCRGPSVMHASVMPLIYPVVSCHPRCRRAVLGQFALRSSPGADQP